MKKGLLLCIFIFIVLCYNNNVFSEDFLIKFNVKVVNNDNMPVEGGLVVKLEKDNKCWSGEVSQGKASISIPFDKWRNWGGKIRLSVVDIPGESNFEIITSNKKSQRNKL